MPGRRSLRYHQRRESEDEFETAALQIAAEQSNRPQPLPAADDSDDELQSESGLGESPEEDLIDEVSSDDDNNKNDNPESDSDSAPEEVSFANSREAEKKRQQIIMGEIRKEKNKEKERRRKKDELFKLQKKEKLAALKKRKLPEEVLKELDQPTEKKQKTDSGQTDSKEDEEEVPSSEEEEEEEEEGEDDDSDLDAEDIDNLEDSGPGDFIKLSSTDAATEQLQVHALKSIHIPSSVSDFKRDILFGRRHKRMTSEQARMQKAKRLVLRQ